MYAVILGGGRIGRAIARDLVDRGHEVAVLEQVPQRCEALVAETGVLVIEGDACDVEYLRQAHTDRADVFVATTHEDDDNLVACQLALQVARREGARRTPLRAISRVNTPKNVEIFQALGIEAVSSTRIISELIEHEAAVGIAVNLTSLGGGRVRLVEVRIPTGDDAPPVRRVDGLGLPHGANVVAVLRGDVTVIPRGDTTVEPGDEVIALTTPELQERLTDALLGRR